MPSLAWVLLFLACLSGTYETLSASWSVAYRWNVVVHPILSVSAVLLLAVSALVHRFGIRRCEEGSGRLWGRRILTGCVLLALASGVVVVVRRMDTTSVRLAAFHAAMGVAAYGLLCWVLASAHGRRTAARPDRRPGRPRGAVRRAAVALLLFAAPYAVHQMAMGWRVPATYAVSVSPLLKHFDEGNKTAVPEDVSKLLAMSDACGVAGCHGDILHDLRNSAHGTSHRTPYFGKNLALLQDEAGPGRDHICAGCHFPGGYFRGEHYPNLREDGSLSCVFCHSVASVWFDRDPSRSGYVLEPNVGHLRLMEDMGNWGPPSKGVARMIRLHPRGHARAFSRPLYKRDEFCLVCHGLQIKPPKDSARSSGATCRDCHMQPRRAIGRVGESRNHLFPGSNTALPFVLGNYEMVDLTRHWLKGNLISRAQASSWGIRAEENKTASWLTLTLEAGVPIVPGRVLQLNVTTTNTGIAHDFPAAPLDLIEVWLAVTARTADGKVIFRSGVPDATGRVPKSAHKLGGYMLDADGRPIERNRVWVTAKKIVERSIPPGGAVKDSFEIPIPKGVGGSLLVEAKWNYRKLNQDFVDWAYGNRNVRMPVSEVARARVAFPVE